MGRIYAGILGPLSFGAIIARNLTQEGHLVSAVWTASCTMFAFAAIGYIIGSVAERTIVEAVGITSRAQWQAGEAVGHSAVSPDASASAPDATA